MKKIILPLTVLAIAFASCGEKKENGGDSTANHAAGTSHDTVAKATTASEPEGLPTEFTGTFNGKEWKGGGYPNSHLYYVQGIKQMYEGKPYLMLAFKAVQGPDNRQLTIAMKDYAGKTGVVDYKNLEILLSGAESGKAEEAAMVGNGTSDKRIPITIEITKFEKTSDTEALISGKMNGELKGMLGSKDVKIENGVFNDVKVKVFPDKY